jgi:hypothetical protein
MLPATKQTTKLFSSESALIDITLTNFTLHLLQCALMAMLLNCASSTGLLHTHAHKRKHAHDCNSG